MKRIIIPLIFVPLFLDCAHAKILSPVVSLRETTEKAELIVIGRVTKVRPLLSFRPFSFGNLKFASIKIEKLLKGKINEKNVKALFYGSKRSFIKNEEEAELRILDFAKGERCIVFLYKRKPSDSVYSVVNYWHGKLRILNTGKGEFVEVPEFFRKNDVLEQQEPLNKIISLINSLIK
jgi:hypothetical protein